MAAFSTSLRDATSVLPLIGPAIICFWFVANRCAFTQFSSSSFVVICATEWILGYGTAGSSLYLLLTLSTWQIILKNQPAQLHDLILLGGLGTSLYSGEYQPVLFALILWTACTHPRILSRLHIVPLNPWTPIAISILASIQLYCYQHELLYFFADFPDQLVHPEFLGGITCFTLLAFFCSGMFFKQSARPLLLIVGMITSAILVLTITWFPLESLFMTPTQIVKAIPLSAQDLIFGVGNGWRSHIAKFLAHAEFLRAEQLPVPALLQILLSAGIINCSILCITLIFSTRERHYPKLIWIFAIPIILLPISALSLASLFFITQALLPAEKQPDPKSRIDSIAVYLTAAAASIAALGILCLSVSAFMHYRTRTTSSEPLPLRASCVAQVLALEDLLFFQHHGLDLARLKQLITQSIKRGAFERGGSTISMQLAKMRGLSYERHLSRKGEQILIALYLEAMYSKQEILESYLKELDFGANFIGIEAAVQGYFNKTVSQLTIKECRLLALSILNPGDFSPALPMTPVVRKRDLTLQKTALRFRKFLARSLSIYPQ